MLGHVQHTEKESGDQNPGICIPDCMLASLRKRDTAPCILSSSLWILYFSLLRGPALMGRRKISQPGESITGCSMAQQSQVGVLLVDHTLMISKAWQNSCLCERQAQPSSSYTLKRKQIQHCLKNLRIAICLIPELLRYSDVPFPVEISVKWIL